MRKKYAFGKRRNKSPQRELLLEHVFHVVSHFLMGLGFSGPVCDGRLSGLGKSGKALQDVRMLGKLHREADGKLFAVYHVITPEIGCAELPGNIRGNKRRFGTLELDEEEYELADKITHAQDIREE